MDGMTLYSDVISQRGKTKHQVSSLMCLLGRFKKNLYLHIFFFIHMHSAKDHAKFQ
jgi:hypothetical protein